MNRFESSNARYNSRMTIEIPRLLAAALVLATVSSAVLNAQKTVTVNARRLQPDADTMWLRVLQKAMTSQAAQQSRRYIPR
jgi:hypothetical protein